MALDDQQTDGAGSGGGGSGGTSTGNTGSTGGSSSGTSNTAPSLFLAFQNPLDGVKTVSAGNTGAITFIQRRSPAATAEFSSQIVVDRIQRITASGAQTISSGISTNFTNTAITEGNERKIQSVLNFSTINTLSPGTYRVYVRAFIPVSANSESTAGLPQTRGECQVNADCRDSRYFCDTSVAVRFQNDDPTDPIYICRLNPQRRADTTDTPTSTLEFDIIVANPPASLTATTPVTVYVNNTATTTATVTRNGDTRDLILKAKNLPNGITATEVEVTSTISTGTIRFTATNNAVVNETGIDIPIELVLKSDPNTVIASTTIKLIIRRDTCANGSCTQDSNCTNGRVCRNGCCVDPIPPGDNRTVTFDPTPSTPLNFSYVRNSNSFPQARTITVTNPSSKIFTISLQAVEGGSVVSAGSSPKIVITPPQIILQPNGTGTFSVAPINSYLQSLATGTYPNITVRATISDS